MKVTVKSHLIYSLQLRQTQHFRVLSADTRLQPTLPNCYTTDGISVLMPRTLEMEKVGNSAKWQKKRGEALG